MASAIGALKVHPRQSQSRFLEFFEAHYFSTEINDVIVGVD
jgi:hypothetical protein